MTIEKVDNRPTDPYIIIGKRIIIILIVVGLGLFVINQYMKFRFQSEYVISPCTLCANLNKNQSSCVMGCFFNRANFYPDGKGGWYQEGKAPSYWQNISTNLSKGTFK